MTIPAPHPTPGRPEDPSVLRARAATTERAYAEDFARFGVWCAAMGARPLPADPMVVMFYLGHLAPTWRAATPDDPPGAVTERGEVCESPGLAPGTLVRHLAAIAAHHVAAGHPNPTRHPLVLDMHRRIRDRAADPSSRRRVAPAIPPRIRSLVADIVAGEGAARDPVAARDVALILLGYTAALRPRELAALTLDQVREDPSLAWIEVRSTAADGAEAEGVDPWASSTHITATGGDTCPVGAWRRWRAWLPDAQGGEGAGIAEVPAFRSIRKGRLGPDGPRARDAARARIGAAALTERSLARIIGARAQHAGLLGHWTAGSLSRRDTSDSVL